MGPRDTSSREGQPTIKSLLQTSRTAKDVALGLLWEEMSYQNNSRGYRPDQMDLELNDKGDVELTLDLSDSHSGSANEIICNQSRFDKLGITLVRVISPIGYYLVRDSATKDVK